jgi:5'-3' exonuclease
LRPSDCLTPGTIPRKPHGRPQLPESIATSTGLPTNAIFGFASTLVTILSDYGPKATVVVWDKGYTG